MQQAQQKPQPQQTQSKPQQRQAPQKVPALTQRNDCELDRLMSMFNSL